MNEHTMNDPLDLDGLDQLFGDDISMPSAADYMAPTSSSKQRDLSFFRQIPVKVTLEVASTEVSLGELMRVEEGAVIELDKLAGETLDVRVNGRLLAKGEVVVVNGKYGLRLVDVIDTNLLGGMDD
ncbi:flagellar motor switch protein FliN [Aeromonas salmonicida subsp. salmonicida]|uniref:Flagellar motor switch protein FliN n=2 Tax=Aeromonas salmonicida subsp. salmonicida TaxID=29491 RepID=A4SI07_AERS4|nr:lateral flagellar motor switch protein LfiN [Aeromonas salmonicida]ABO88529.1 lateral flagellar motor switch protein, lfiN [Aeromonas salmonicida subsp. salmonicida A449]ASI24935.1 flagellar motor switch protein FliN [Aeromonas salmonicida]ASI29254.1 flagellar motor switch protein FliN [Aeromonas salmonicida]ASI33386.1 flagellar motor switch protein FliN [Aeromonas salmonicida]ATD36950.1 flagellar motor switch protein FliN [Aeromonas salmonicida subsp. masoucida]